MITLTQLIDATTWLNPQDYMKIAIWDKSKVYEEGEFKEIELNIRNLAKYGDYQVTNIDVEEYDDGKIYLSCLIWKD